MPCDRCKSIMFADRDELHLSRHLGREVICEGCKQVLRVFANDVMNVVEERAGLTEERRRALEYLTDLAVNDPEKALKLRNLDERVESLQRGREPQVVLGGADSRLRRGRGDPRRVTVALHARSYHPAPARPSSALTAACSKPRARERVPPARVSEGFRAPLTLVTRTLDGPRRARLRRRGRGVGAYVRRAHKEAMGALGIGGENNHHGCIRFVVYQLYKMARIFRRGEAW